MCFDCEIIAPINPAVAEYIGIPQGKYLSKPKYFHEKWSHPCNLYANVLNSRYFTWDDLVESNRLGIVNGVTIPLWEGKIRQIVVAPKDGDELAEFSGGRYDSQFFTMLSDNSCCTPPTTDNWRCAIQ